MPFADRCYGEVHIVYIYQPPLIAWNYTKLREKHEGRSVPKEIFVRAFCEAPRNVKRIKRKFGRKVKVVIVKKDYEKGIQEAFEGMKNFDRIIKLIYNADELQKLLR